MVERGPGWNEGGGGYMGACDVGHQVSPPPPPRPHPPPFPLHALHFCFTPARGAPQPPPPPNRPLQVPIRVITLPLVPSYSVVVRRRGGRGSGNRHYVFICAAILAGPSTFLQPFLSNSTTLIAAEPQILCPPVITQAPSSSPQKTPAEQ